MRLAHGPIWTIGSILLTRRYNGQAGVAERIGRDVGRYLIVATDAVRDPAGFGLLRAIRNGFAGLALTLFETTPFAGHQAYGKK